MIVNIDLLEEILDRIEYENLIEEGRDPIEVLHYKFQHIPSDLIDKVISIDPTKKKSYSQWLLSRWGNEQNTIVNNLKNGRIEKLFQHYKTHPEIQIKDCPSVEEGLRAFVPEEDTVLTKSSAPMTYVENLGEEVPSDVANDFDIVFNEDNWIIAVPNTYEAECKLGENMAWCTANHFGNGESYYNNYLSEGGKYYVNFDMSRGETAKGKDYPFTRYQFHFESKQFMDKNDNPVSLDEIGIPDSAMRFYESEGYDTSDFEDLEAKIERYDEWRYHNAYFALNDELSLNVSYDYDYEAVDLDENTEFYIFDENDDRDPISWDEVPNPHVFDNVVLLNKEDYIVLREKGGDEEENESILAIRENSSSSRHSYRNWGTYRIKRWFELPNEIGIFGLTRENDNHFFSVFTTNMSEVYHKLPVNSCEKIFVNEACTKADSGEWDRLFIEAIADGYHSLFTISQNPYTGDDFECIIRRDDPKNGAYYFIDENGVIEGAYGRYRAYDDGSDDGQEYTQYVLESELSNGDYVVSMESYDGRDHDDPRTYLNILKRGQKEPLLKEWVDEVITFDCNTYVVSRDKQVAFFDLGGNQVGDWYNVWGFLDKQLGVAVGKIGSRGNYEQTDFISTQERRVFAQFRDLATNYQSDHKVVVLPYSNVNEGGLIAYDYAKREFCHQELGTMKRLRNYDDKNFFCFLRDSNEKVIFNFKDQQVVVNNIDKIENIRYSDFYKLIKLDGKVNMYDSAAFKQVLDYDVDAVNEVIVYKNVVIYALNGRNYIYNYKNKSMIGNPNGFNLDVYTDSSGYYVFSDGSYCVRFYLTQNDTVFKGWYDKFKSSANYGYQINENTPQEVVNIYNEVINQQQQPQQQQQPNYAVSEEFKKVFKRLDEARKRMQNDRFVE